MSIPGTSMHRQLMEGYRTLQNRLESMRHRLPLFDDQRGDMGDKRSEALLDLAKHYLPDLTPESINSTWLDVRGSLSGVLMRMEDERRGCVSESAKHNDRRAIEEDRLLEINESLDELVERRDTLSGEVERELAADESFVQLTRQAAAAEAALERAEANLNEIEQDAARKLPAYEKSALFKYLHDRDYGTERYGKRGFTRRMDRWVAKLIDFSKAKHSYDFLVNTPEQMRTIIADDRRALDTVMGELEKRRDEVVQRSGLDVVLEKVDQFSADRQAQLERLDEIRARSEELDVQLNDLENPNGKYYRQAVETFREMLASINTRDLDRRAQQTQTLTDDQIVARIHGIESDIDQLDADSRRFQTELSQLQGALDGYGRLMQRFRAAKFDAARSQFTRSVDIASMVERIKDSRDVDDLWQTLRRSQRWGPTFGDQVGNVSKHPVTNVLIGAMAMAAGTMQEHARRAGERRSEKYDSGKRYKAGGDWDDSSSDDRKRR